MESDIRELYKKTPLKKRPIQPSSLSPDEKKVSPKPKVFSVPEGRLSKRKMLKPTKKIIESFVESTKVIEQVPVMRTSEDKESSPVKRNNKALNKATEIAIPEYKKKVPSRFSKTSKALCKNKQELEDKELAMRLQKQEFNLRERRSSTKLKSTPSPPASKNPATGNGDNFSISSPEMPNEAANQGKQERRLPEQAAVKIEQDENNIFTGSQNMCILSLELANIVGHKKMSASAIIEAMHYVFLERNLFEKDKRYVTFDAELSEKIFLGKRRLLFEDIRLYLLKHVTLTD